MINRWLRSYSPTRAAGDLSAALVVVIMLVPQGLAYAQLAGVPPQTGLYASILPLVAYALFGSSSTLAVGPVAVTSLMTAAALAQLTPVGSPEYAVLAGWLALLSGVMLFVAGMLRLGFIANLMSDSVVVGFISGASVLIVLGQLKSLFGMQGGGHTALEIMRSLYAERASVNMTTTIVGSAALGMLVICQYRLGALLVKLKLSVERANLVVKLAPLFIVVVATMVSAMGNLHADHGLVVVGTISAGLPAFGLRALKPDELRALLMPALTIGLIGFVGSVSTAQSLGFRRHERIAPNDELRGLGAANIAAALSGGFPVTGGLSRSIVNYNAGAQTPIAGIYAALLMACVLLTLTGWFAPLPTTVLAATIIVPAISLIDLSRLAHAWRCARSDAWALIGTALGVIVCGVEIGIAVGIAISIGNVLWQVSRPHIAKLGRVPGTEQYLNVDRAEVETNPAVLILRIDENIFFANVRAVEDRILAALTEHPAVADLVLDLSAVNFIDYTALERLIELNRNLRGNGLTLHLARVKGPVMDRLARSDLLNELSGQVFRFVHEALTALKR